MNVYIIKDHKNNPLCVLLAECMRDAKISVQGVYNFHDIEEITAESYNKNKDFCPVIRLLTSDPNLNSSFMSEYKVPILKR